MCQEDADTGRESILGVSVSEAATAIVADRSADAEDDSLDRDAVEETLRVVAEDGEITRSSVESTLGDLSKVVSTPETRTELASIALGDAREAADHVAELDVVRSRLEAFDTRLGAIEDRTAALGEDLQNLVDRRDDLDNEDVYALARDVRELTERASDVQLAADDLQMDLEEFERWVGNPDVRTQDLEDDVTALEEALGQVGDAVDRLAGLDDGDPTAAVPHPGVAWADASLRIRLYDLLCTDLRAELAALRTWTDREDLDDDQRPDGIETRLDDLETLRSSLADRLEDLARSAWKEQYGDRLAAFEDALSEFEPPVRWVDVQAELDEHRGAIADR